MLYHLSHQGRPQQLFMKHLLIPSVVLGGGLLVGLVLVPTPGESPSECSMPTAGALVCVLGKLRSEAEGFPGGSVVKNPPANAGDVRSIPGLGRCPGEGNGNPLQYSCLGNPMEEGPWWATVHGVAKSQTRLSDLTHFKLIILN